jgi:hypothetical protein
MVVASPSRDPSYSLSPRSSLGSRTSPVSLERLGSTNGIEA